MMRRSLSAIAALLLLVSAAQAAGVVEADDKLLASIQTLVDRSRAEKLSSSELNQLHSLIVQAEDKAMPSWQGASLEEINNSATGKLWKRGNAAILDQVQRAAAQRTGTLGFMPSGKSFMDDAFDPRNSDYDATVLGPRSAAGAEEFVKAAPADFIERRKFSVMSANGNFTRYRGSPETAGKPLTAEQMKVARDKAVAQTAALADSGGGYLSRGSMGHLESQIASGKYAGQVTFYSSAGYPMGKMPLANFGSMAERFGVVENHLGDVLGMAADNDAQLANYLVQKGKVAGSAKVLQRQSEVIARLPPEVRDELLKDKELAWLLRDADEVSAAMKKGDSAAAAVKKTGLTADEFAKRAQAASERVVRAAGRDLVRNAGVGAGTGARLMVEQNVLGAIVNAGGVDKFRELHAGNKQLLAMADDIARDYGKDTIAKLAGRRGAAIGNGVATAARSAGIPEAELFDLLGDRASLAGKTTAKTARGMVGEMVAGVGIDAAIAIYQLSHGDREGAARSLVEGGITYALPEAGLALLLKDITRASMELAIEQATGPYKDSRLAKTWPYVQAAIAENQDKIVRSISGAFSPDDLMDVADQFLNDSSGYVTFPGLEKQVQAQLAAQLFAIRDQVRDAYLTNQYFRKYLELKAWNQEWDRQQQERLMAALDSSLKQDEARARQDAAKPPTGGAPTTKPALPQTATQDAPTGGTADKRRAWQPDKPSAAAPVQPTQQQSSPSIITRQIEADQAAKLQRDAAEIARLDGMCKCFFETQYQNDCVTGEAQARKQNKEWEGRCEIKEPARYDAEAKKCVGYFVSYWRAHPYDDMKSYKSGYGYLKWPTVPTYCGTRR
jgi:hypothetical protein